MLMRTHNSVPDGTGKDAYVRLHAAILLAGGTGLFGRLISIGELPLVGIRVIVASLLLAALLGARKQLAKLPWAHLWRMMGCGALLSIHWVLYYGSIKAANISIGAVCFALVGFFTAIVEPVLERRAPSWRELLLSLLTVAGIALIFGLDPRYRIGIAIGVLSSIVFTFFSIFSKRVQSETGCTSSTMLLYEMIGGAVVLLLLLPPYALAFPNAGIIPTWKDAGWLLLFSTVFTIAPFLLQLQALRHISAFTVNLSYNLEPVYTILLAMIFFGEAGELNGGFWLGILLIVVSVVLQTVAAIRSRRRDSETQL